MLKQGLLKPLCALAAVATLASLHSASAEKHPPVAERSIDPDTQTPVSFMHAKLRATHHIIDGLAFEDFNRVEEGAEELLRMTELASWKVRRDPVYMHYSADFERTATRLRDAARAHSIEKATFAYMHLTVSCTTCHQHVRNVVQVAPASGARLPDVGPTVIR